MTIGDSQAAFEAIALHGFAERPPHCHDEPGRISSVADPDGLAFDPAAAISVHSRISSSNGQSFAALAAATGNDRSTGGGAHALAKPVLVPAFSIAGLKCPFHRFLSSSIS